MSEYKVVRRGYRDGDDLLFSNKNILKLSKAVKDTLYLLNAGYSLKSATLFVANHYQLYERQRLILSRALTTNEAVNSRKGKIVSSLKDKIVYIDGFNAIVPMETALSKSLLIGCMDGAVRDLADLKGNYHIIDKTPKAIRLLLGKLDELEVTKAIIHLDKPISNSGRLRGLILQISQEFSVDVEVELLNAVDASLYDKENVISGDSVVIDKCISWYPLYTEIVKGFSNVWMIAIAEDGEITVGREGN